MGYGFGHRISIGSIPIVSASSAPVPTIWKVAIFGAGTTTSNGEYVWDGVTIANGKPYYLLGNNELLWDGAQWLILDIDGLGGDSSYSSLDLITWSTENGASPAPTSTLSYSENSYIQTVVLADGDPDQSGNYTWNGTTFVNGKPRYVGPLKSNAPTNNSIQFTGTEYILNGYSPAGEEMIDQSASTDLVANWTEADCVTAPTVSSIIYTA